MRLLVSVRNKTEAIKALRGGCDFIDIKNPENGSLGKASDNTISEILSAVAGRRPVSAACGELVDLIQAPLPSWPQNLANLDFVKAGPANLLNLPNWSSDWHELIQKMRISCINRPAPLKWVAVIYADGTLVNAPPPLPYFEHACQIGCSGLLIDTCQKGNRRLLDWLSPEQLFQWRRRTREAGLFLALAGSLTLADLPTIARAQPDIVAIRGAVCLDSHRTNEVDESLVRIWKEHLTHYSSQSLGKHSSHSPTELQSDPTRV